MTESAEIVLDGMGNIDQKVLEKSLRNALDFDIKYKQRDNMKKRACKTAASYDEFKAMVDSAHLKKLSRQEIESLSTKKQGWGKSTAVKNGEASANILAEEMVSIEKSQLKKGTDLKKLSSGKIKTPKTPLELSRDLRRLITDQEKIIYLQTVGVQVTTKLMKHETDAELFETILMTLLLVQDAAANTTTTTSTSTSTIATTDSKPAAISMPVVDNNLSAWFMGMAGIDNFGLLIRFVSSELTNKIVCSLESHIIHRHVPVATELATSIAIEATTTQHQQPEQQLVTEAIRRYKSRS